MEGCPSLTTIRPHNEVVVGSSPTHPTTKHRYGATILGSVQIGRVGLGLECAQGGQVSDPTSI